MEPDDHVDCCRIMNHPVVVRQQMAPPFTATGEYAEQFVNTPEIRHVVAEDDGVVVGFGRLRLHAGRRSHAAAIELAVDPDQMDHGIRLALLGALVDLGEDWYGVKRSEIKVYVDDDHAIALYEQFGFEIEATHREFVQRDGAYADVHSMSRLVQ